MTEHPVEELRAQASRGDYVSMARLAKALYGQGLTTAEVVSECYGTGFPDEFFVLAADRLTKPRLMVDLTGLPWRLCTSPAEGGPPMAPSALTGEAERDVFARDPDLAPLVQLLAPRETRENAVIGYRITDLRAGGTAVFRCRVPAASEEEIERCGESLLGFLHTHHLEYLRAEERIRRSPGNWGFGAVDRESVDGIRSLVEGIEGLQREVGRIGT
ncbi:hypothetical protein [Amycolatopsis sp. NPDC049159]|uniref:hypothetical protein n=1 Tax=Amycolatopsis sp. NPDC049159 TaxID=3157210 RepID=UPI0033CF620D